MLLAFPTTPAPVVWKNTLPFFLIQRKFVTRDRVEKIFSVQRVCVKWRKQKGKSRVSSRSSSHSSGLKLVLLGASLIYSVMTVISQLGFEQFVILTL